MQYWMHILTAACDNVKNNIYTGLILLDLKKAFDIVYHSLLLLKLERCGIRGIAYKPINSFLSNRYQYVVHPNFRSKLTLNRFGVPRGSALGQLFI